MNPRRQVMTVWLVLGTLAMGIVALLWGPMRVAWHCYWLAENGVRQQAEVVKKLDDTTFALLITEGPNASQACTADTSVAIYEATGVGDVLEVVYVESKPGECELSSTIEASAQFLWVATGGVGLLLVGVLSVGALLTRSFTRPVQPERRMQVDPHGMRCPACGKHMDEGYLPLLAGIHWRKLGDPLGMPHALAGLPGTIARSARPRVHAFRCVPCEILTLQYGEPRRA